MFIKRWINYYNVESACQITIWGEYTDTQWKTNQVITLSFPIMHQDSSWKITTDSLWISKTINPEIFQDILNYMQAKWVKEFQTP